MTSQPASRPRPSSDSPCPCGSGLKFGECCEPILQQRRPAATAEQLMRSRFTAHVVHDHQHLHRTYGGTMNKPYVEETTAMTEATWTRLVIHSHEVQPDRAFVDFTAYFQNGDAEVPHHEKAEFERANGSWIYTRAVRLGPAPIKAAPKVGRNDPCPCGSGKKYKHCCGR
jgi:SEC-C motif-containing protein